AVFKLRITAKSRCGRSAPLPSTAADVERLSAPRSVIDDMAPDAGHGTRRLDIPSSLAPSLRSGAHVGRHVSTRFTLYAIRLAGKPVGRYPHCIIDVAR